MTHAAIHRILLACAHQVLHIARAITATPEDLGSVISLRAFRVPPQAPLLTVIALPP